MLKTLFDTFDIVGGSFTMMGMSETLPANASQSAWPPGLHPGQSPEEWIFALPAMGDDELRYTVDSGQAITVATKAIATRSVKALIRTAYPLAGSVAIQTSEVVAEVLTAENLVDSAVSHMLDTVGDAHSREAARVLREAIEEPVAEGKDQLRTRAAGLLHAAYSEYRTSIDVKTALLEAEPSWKRHVGRLLLENLSATPKPAKLEQEIIDLHARAASRELAIAILNREMGLLSAMNSRTDNALEHFSMHFGMRLGRAYNEIEGGLSMSELNRLGGVPVSRLVSTDFEGISTFEELSAAMSTLERAGKDHIAAVRGWDGRGTDARMKFANFFMEITGETREERLRVHSENLGRIQGAVDDLGRLRTSHRSFHQLLQDLKS